MTFSERAEAIQPFRVVELLERAKRLEATGANVVHLEVGEPDFVSAEPIVRAGIESLQRGETGYTEPLGIPPLRNAISQYYAAVCGVEVDPRRIVVTTGASAALNLVAMALVDSGDAVLMTDPGYPCNATFVEAAGGKAIAVAVDAEHGFQLDAGSAADAWDQTVKGMLLASPSNPTGSMLSRDGAAELFALARDRDGFVVVDEIYQGLVFDDAGDDLLRGSCLSLDQDAYVINSFSKYFGMTGWRLGWLVVPPAALSVVERLAQNLYIAPPVTAQHAALAAFSEQAMAEHERRREAFAARRDHLIEGLESIGFDVAFRPPGAFYLYVDIAATGLDAETFCARLIDDYHVAVTPGSDFGTYRSEQHVRFAFTTSIERISTGLERLETALAEWRD